MKNNTFICIACRTTGRDAVAAICPLCRQSMHNMGPAFRTPRKRNDNEWRKLQLLIEHRLQYFRWRCDCVGCSSNKVPRTLSSWMHRYGRKRQIPVT